MYVKRVLFGWAPASESLARVNGNRLVFPDKGEKVNAKVLQGHKKNTHHDDMCSLPVLGDLVVFPPFHAIWYAYLN